MEFTKLKILSPTALVALLSAGPAAAQPAASFYESVSGRLSGSVVNCPGPQGITSPVPFSTSYDCSGTSNVGTGFSQIVESALTSGGQSPMVDVQMSLTTSDGEASASIYYYFVIAPVNPSVPIYGVQVPVNISTRASVSYSGVDRGYNWASATATLSDSSMIAVNSLESGLPNDSKGLSKQYQLFMGPNSPRGMYMKVWARGRHLCSPNYGNTCTATVEIQAVVDPTIVIDPSFPMRDQYKVVLSGNLLAIPRDFAGNARSDALLYDLVSGAAYTALSNGNGLYNYVSELFTPAFDTLRSGDFNGDGKADLVLYNSHNALAYIGTSKGDGTFTFQSLFWSPSYAFVEAGDLNGDGKTDFALYNSATGTMYTAISNGSGGFTYKYTLISPGFTFVRLADFTGDGTADIFLYNATNGAAYLGLGGGDGAFTFHPLFVSPGYNLADVGDLDGDGKSDLILYNSVNGLAATGISNGAGDFAFTPLQFSPGFTSVRLADHNGDGKTDVTVYNRNSGSAYFGIGTGTGTFNFQSLFWSPGYDWVVPQDVNGDGYVDVVLYNSATGTEYTGISDGNGMFAYTYQYWGIGRVLAR